MRNRTDVALAGAGLMAIALVVFAAVTSGQTAPSAPSQPAAPQAQPAPPAAPEAADSIAKELEADMQSLQAQRLEQLSAKLAELNANMTAMEPELNQVEKKVVELTPDEDMVIADGDESGWLGIEIGEISADRAKELKLSAVRGVEVVSVDEDSPAAKAGLKENDVITTFDGQVVEGRVQFRRLVRETPPGRTVSLGISRDGSARTLNVVMGDRSDQDERSVSVFHGPQHIEMPPPSAFVMPDLNLHFTDSDWMDMRTPLLGISAEDLSGQLGAYFGAPNNEGVLVREVKRGTPAEKAGLKAGDVITKVDDKPVKSLHDLRTELRDKTDQKTVNLGVLRKGSMISVPIEIEKPRPIDPPQILHRAQM
jgi:serine protease Do